MEVAKFKLYLIINIPYYLNLFEKTGFNILEYSGD